MLSKLPAIAAAAFWREGGTGPKIPAYRLMAGWPESDCTATAGDGRRLLAILCANNDVAGPGGSWKRLPFRQRLFANAS